MINVEKYLSIPYVSQGRDFNGCDCYGLVKLILEGEFNKSLPSLLDEYDSALNILETAPVMSMYRPLLAGKQVTVPKEGDIAVIKYRGSPCHLGVFIGDDRIVHILKKTGYAVCEKINSPFLREKIEGYYEVN